MKLLFTILRILLFIIFIIPIGAIAIGFILSLFCELDDKGDLILTNTGVDLLWYIGIFIGSIIFVLILLAIARNQEVESEDEEKVPNM
jgi:cytosine/uracil/thiamine/allantoin permease